MKIAIDTHSHTIASGHAYCTIREMASAAAKKDCKDLRLQNMLQRCREPVIHFIFLIKSDSRQMSGVEMLLVWS